MPPILVWAPARRAYRVVRHRRLSPRGFRMVTGVALSVMLVIIVSGAAVRLTGSGLACPTWPKCTSSSVVAPAAIHPWIEFGNRLINAGIGIVALGALAAALVRVRRRRDLTWLSVGLIVGVMVEIVLGGITVLYKLAPQLVAVHFLLAVLFLADALTLYHRAGWPDEEIPQRPGRARVAGTAALLVSSGQRRLAGLLVAVAAVVVTLGTVVTSTGPHGGDPTAPRFAFSLHDVAQIHADAADTFVGLVIVMCWWLARSGVARSVLRRAEVLLVVVVAQGALGYVQYSMGDPATVVEFHVAGSVAVIVATVAFYLGLSTRSDAPRPTGEATPSTVAITSPASLGVG